MQWRKCFTKTVLLNYKITLPLAKLGMISSKLVSNDLVLSIDIPVNIQLVTFLLVSNIRELSIQAKSTNSFI